jgi:hypothetical protein
MSTACGEWPAGAVIGAFDLGKLLHDAIGSSAIAHIMLWMLVLGLVIALAVFALRRLRERIDKDEEQPGEMLSNFREMHLSGDLSDAEFRTIKTVLGAKLQNKTKDHPEKL